MDKATPENKILLGKDDKCGQNPDMDSRFSLRNCLDSEKTT